MKYIIACLVFLSAFNTLAATHPDGFDWKITIKSTIYKHKGKPEIREDAIVRKDDVDFSINGSNFDCVFMFGDASVTEWKAKDASFHQKTQSILMACFSADKLFESTLSGDCVQVQAENANQKLQWYIEGINSARNNGVALSLVETKNEVMEVLAVQAICLKQ